MAKNTTLRGNSNAEKAYNFFLDHGLTPAQAAGVVGNLMHESGVDPTNTNSIGAHGIAQWLGDRRTGLYGYASRTGQNPDSLTTQLDYMWYEFHHGESGSYSALQGSNSPEEAAYVVFKDYERAGDSSGPTRAGYAEDAYHKYGSGTGVQEASPADRAIEEASTDFAAQRRGAFGDLDATAKKAGLNPENIAETHAGTDGRVIFTMANGNQVSVDPATGKHFLAGHVHTMGMGAGSGAGAETTKSITKTGAVIVTKKDGSRYRVGYTNPYDHNEILDFNARQKPVPLGGPTSGNSKGASTTVTDNMIDEALGKVGKNDTVARNALKNAQASLDKETAKPGGGSHGVTDPMAATILAGTTNYEAPAQAVGLPSSYADNAPSCFIAGSKVSTPDGEKNIEEIKLGDMVNTYNMENKAVEPTQVTDTLAHHDRHTLEIEVEDGRKLITTVEHPLWTGQDWVPAGIVRVGTDSLFDKEGKLQKVVAVKVGPKTDVYNFHVTAPAHNYFVEELLVHNLKAVGM
jgi:hypothetical protein